MSTWVSSHYLHSHFGPVALTACSSGCLLTVYAPTLVLLPCQEWQPVSDLMPQEWQWQQVSDLMASPSGYLLIVFTPTLVLLPSQWTCLLTIFTPTGPVALTACLSGCLLTVLTPTLVLLSSQPQVHLGVFSLSSLHSAPVSLIEMVGSSGCFLTVFIPVALTGSPSGYFLTAFTLVTLTAMVGPSACLLTVVTPTLVLFP
ncbi:hypothetical protein V8B97DRAFT_1920265 [Scleroderma yunnanense]